MGRSPLSPNRSTWPNSTVSCYLLWRAEKAIDDGLALSTSLLVPFTDRLWIVDRRATQRTARGVEEGAQALRSPCRATAAPTCGPWRRDPIPNDATDPVQGRARGRRALTAGFGLRRTYRPRRPSNIPDRRRRPRAASLSRSSRTLRWTFRARACNNRLASAAGAGPAFAGPIGRPTVATPEDTSSTPTMARITATPRNLICEPPGRAALLLSAA